MDFDERKLTDGIVVRYGRAMRLREITPELAREWLGTLPYDGKWPGGKLDPDKVRSYAKAMRDGTWKLMELPVVFRNGRLLSSRHRMAAVVEYGKPVVMYVSDDNCPR